MTRPANHPWKRDRRLGGSIAAVSKKSAIHRMFALGKSDGEMATTLGLTEETVRSYRLRMGLRR